MNSLGPRTIIVSDTYYVGHFMYIVHIQMTQKRKKCVKKSTYIIGTI